MLHKKSTFRREICGRCASNENSGRRTDSRQLLLQPRRTRRTRRRKGFTCADRRATPCNSPIVLPRAFPLRLRALRGLRGSRTISYLPPRTRRGHRNPQSAVRTGMPGPGQEGNHSECPLFFSQPRRARRPRRANGYWRRRQSLSALDLSYRKTTQRSNGREVACLVTYPAWGHLNAKPNPVLRMRDE